MTPQNIWKSRAIANTIKSLSLAVRAVIHSRRFRAINSRNSPVTGMLRVLLAVFIAGSVSSAIAVLPSPAAPKPKPTPKHIAVRIQLPTVPLHTEFVVEVNKRGQVVRVKSGKSSKNLFFNTQTYGNVLQMWIRHPDGSATIGLYRVTYDYSPKTHKIRRGIALVRTGGNWGNAVGAVSQMLATDRQSAQKTHQTAPEHVNLPSLDLILASPTPHAPKP